MVAMETKANSGAGRSPRQLGEAFHPMTTRPTGGHVPLSVMADAVGLVAAVADELAASEVLVEVVPDEVPRPDDRGATAVWCTRLRISAPDEEAARDLARVLRLPLRPADGGGPVPYPAWSGIYPLSEVARRPLRVDLALTDQAPGPAITLREALAFVDLLAGVVLTNIPVVLIRLRARDTADGAGGEAEIHTADPHGAQTLRLELAGVQLPLRPVVHAPDHRAAP